jgi:hypothetical protein
MEGYVRSLTALCVAEVKLSDDVAVCFAPRDQMYEAALINKGKKKQKKKTKKTKKILNFFLMQIRLDFWMLIVQSMTE